MNRDPPGPAPRRETAEEQLAPKKRRGPAQARRRAESAGAKRGREPVHVRGATPSARAPRRARRAGLAAAGGSAGSPRPSPQGRRGPPRGPPANAAQGRAALLRAARPPKPKPVWNWVRRSARPAGNGGVYHYRSTRGPARRRVCSMNTDHGRARKAAQEDEARSTTPSSRCPAREIIFNAEGKYRPPFSERRRASIFVDDDVNGRTPTSRPTRTRPSSTRRLPVAFAAERRDSCRAVGAVDSPTARACISMTRHHLAATTAGPPFRSSTAPANAPTLSVMLRPRVGPVLSQSPFPAETPRFLKVSGLRLGSSTLPLAHSLAFASGTRVSASTSRELSRCNGSRCRCPPLTCRNTRRRPTRAPFSRATAAGPPAASLFPSSRSRSRSSTAQISYMRPRLSGWKPSL